MEDVLPRKIRSLAMLAQIIAIVGIVVILWFVVSFAYIAFVNNEEFDEMLKFAHAVMLGSPDFQTLVGSGLAKYPLPESFSISTRVAVFLTEMMINFVGLYALYWAWLLFRGYGQGNIFSDVSAKRLELVGWSVVALMPVSKLSEFWTLKTIIISPFPSQVFFSYSANDLELISIVGVDALDVFAVVFGLLIVLVGRILSEASRLSEENRSFI